MEIKPFYLLRHEDINGKSGVGIVAMGAQLPSGHCIMEWLSITSSISIFQNMAALIEIHSHGGKTEIVMGDPPKKKGRKKKNAIED